MKLRLIRGDQLSLSLASLTDATADDLLLMCEVRQEATYVKHHKKKIVFLDSPVMSTYLLAFVVGEFDFVQSTSKHGVTIRTFTPPGKSTCT